MKICYVTNYLPGYHPRCGGADQAILWTENLIKEKSHETFFLTLPFRKGLSFSKKKNSISNIRSVFVLENILGTFGKYVEIIKWYVLQFDPISFVIAKKIFRDIKPDIVHFGDFQVLTFSVLLAAKQLKIPVVASIYAYWYFCPLMTLVDYKNRLCRKFHNTWCIECLPKTLRFIQVILLRFRKKVFDFFLNTVDKFIALSKSSEQILIDYGIDKDKIAVIPLPIEKELNHNIASNQVEKNTVLFMGWMEKRKGLHILLDAMARVISEVPSVKFYLVVKKVKWEKDYEKLIISKMAGIPKHNYILITGQLNRNEIKELLNKATIVIVPEQWENMSPLIIIEAMSAGKPIVASNLGGIPELIEDGISGLLAHYNTPSDFADKVIYLLRNPEKSKELGLTARTRIALMSNKEKIAQEYLSIYKQLIDK